MNLLQRAPWEPGQERADLTALEITRSGIVSVVHQLGTPLLHGPHQGSDPQGYSVAQLVTAPIADALRRGMARALRERQLATARYEGDGIAEDYLMVPLGRDRVLVIARDDRMPAAMLARAEALAYEDPVTGLPNRARLETLLQSLVANQAVREGRLAVIAVHLSQLDDLCFGLGGDQLETVLRVLAERLQEQVRGSNAVDEEDPERFSLVARTDYRQFVVVLPQIAGGDDAERVAERMCDVLSEPIVVDARTVFVSPRIGVALFPQDGADQEALVEAATSAMEVAREAPEAMVQMHSGTVSMRMEHRQDVASELRNALQQQRFELQYLPSVCAGDGQVIGLEALLRWPEALLSNQSATHILSVAERTGVIVEIGDWVMREALGQLARWQGAAHATVRMAINVSTQEFVSRDLSTRLAEHAVRAGVDLGDVDLEVREHLLVRDARHGFRSAGTLVDTGARLVLDDFGSGACPIQDVSAGPIHGIKIARSLVRELQVNASSTACRAAIAAARVLVPRVIANGVEDAAQADSLRGFGCTELQGYFFAQPLAADAVSEWLRNRAQVDRA